MFYTTKIAAVCAFCFFFIEIANAQKLVSKSSKSWEIHFGVFGGASASTYFNNFTNSFEVNIPETATTFEINHAPRPEVNLGVFAEFVFSPKFSYRTTVSYMMRSIPAPVFNNSISKASNTYQSIYSSGLAVSGTWFFKPSSRFKVGLGYDYVQFINDYFLKGGDYASYSQTFKASRGLRSEWVYSKDKRTDIALTVSVANTNMDKIQVDNLSVGATVYYRLCGKLIKLQKEVYQLDY